MNHLFTRPSVLVACLVVWIASAGNMLSAGGVLLFSQNGASYVSAVKYETFTQPTAHIAFVSVKGGKRMQVQASGIVAQIPFPDPVTPTLVSDAEGYAAQCSMLASTYPQYAGILQATGEAWQRYAVAQKLEEERFAKVRAEQAKKAEEQRLVKVAEEHRLAQEAVEKRKAQEEQEHLAQIEENKRISDKWEQSWINLAKLTPQLRADHETFTLDDAKNRYYMAGEIAFGISATNEEIDKYVQRSILRSYPLTIGYYMELVDLLADIISVTKMYNIPSRSVVELLSEEQKTYKQLNVEGIFSARMILSSILWVRSRGNQSEADIRNRIASTNRIFANFLKSQYAKNCVVLLKKLSCLSDDKKATTIINGRSVAEIESELKKAIQRTELEKQDELYTELLNSEVVGSLSSIQQEKSEMNDYDFLVAKMEGGFNVDIVFLLKKRELCLLIKMTREGEVAVQILNQYNGSLEHIVKDLGWNDLTDSQRLVDKITSIYPVMKYDDANAVAQLICAASLRVRNGK